MKIIIFLLICLNVFAIVNLFERYDELKDRVDIAYVYFVKWGLYANTKPIVVWDYNEIAHIYLANDGSVHIPLVAKDEVSLNKIGLQLSSWDNWEENKVEMDNVLTLDSLLGFKQKR